MSNKHKVNVEVKKAREIPKKKVFVEPKLMVYEPLVDITLFTSTANVTGGSGSVGGGTFF